MGFWVLDIEAKSAVLTVHNTVGQPLALLLLLCDLWTLAAPTGTVRNEDSVCIVSLCKHQYKMGFFFQR